MVIKSVGNTRIREKHKLICHCGSVEAASGAEGLISVRKLRPDLLLLDLNMKEMSGLKVLKEIKRADLDTRVVMVTVSDAAEDLVGALRAGADGTCSRTWSPRR